MLFKVTYTINLRQKNIENAMIGDAPADLHAHWEKQLRNYDAIKAKTTKKRKELVDDNDELTKIGSVKGIRV